MKKLLILFSLLLLGHLMKGQHVKLNSFSGSSIQELQNSTGFMLSPTQQVKLDSLVNEINIQFGLETYTLGVPPILFQSKDGLMDNFNLAKHEIGDKDYLLICFTQGENNPKLFFNFILSGANKKRNQFLDEEKRIGVAIRMKHEAEIEMEESSLVNIYDGFIKGVEILFNEATDNSDFEIASDLLRAGNDDVSFFAREGAKNFIAPTGHILNLDDPKKASISFVGTLNWTMPIGSLKFFRSKENGKTRIFLPTRLKRDKSIFSGYAYKVDNSYHFFKNQSPGIDTNIDVNFGVRTDECGSYRLHSIAFDEQDIDLSGKFQGRYLSTQEIIDRTSMYSLVIEDNRLNVSHEDVHMLPLVEYLTTDYVIPCTEILTASIEAYSSRQMSVFNPMGLRGTMFYTDVGIFYYLSSNEEDNVNIWQYNHTTSALEPIDISVLKPHRIFMNQLQYGADAHNLLGLLGATEIILLSPLADLSDGLIYFLEGNHGEGALSVASAIPGVGTAVYATRGSKIFGIIKGGKHVDGAKLQSILTNKYPDVSDDLYKQFSEDLLDIGLASKLEDDPDLIDTWFLITKSKSQELKNLRHDPDFFTKFSEALEEIDDLEDFIKNSKSDSGLLSWKYTSQAFPNSKIKVCKK